MSDMIITENSRLSHPDEGMMKEISIFDLSNSTKDFLLEYFSGAVEVKLLNIKPRFLKVSLRSYANIFKLIFKEVFGESIVNVTVDCDEFNFLLSIVYKTKSKPDENYLSKLKELSLSAGFDKFDFKYSEKIFSISMSAPLTKTNYIPIYAMGRKQLEYVFASVFSEEDKN